MRENSINVMGHILLTYVGSKQGIKVEPFDDFFLFHQRLRLFAFFASFLGSWRTLHGLD